MPSHSATLETLLRVIRELRRGYDRSAADVGLTLSRARALTTLAHHDGITQTELAAELAIEAPTLKRQIDALVAGGFVERRPLDGDGRKNGLVVTERGRDSAIVEFTHRLRGEVLEGIDPQDLDRAAQVLDRIARNIERMDRT